MAVVVDDFEWRAPVAIPLLGLIQSGHIRQIAGRADRRQRRLYPTNAGRELILELSRPQSRRIADALQACGLSDDVSVSCFMRAMIDAGDRELLAALGGE